MTVALPIDVRVYRFKPDNLDPITVYVEQFSEVASRIIIHCWDQSWTAFWGGHGSEGLERFFLESDDGYLFGYLISGWRWRLLKREVRNQADYLKRIIEAIKTEFAKHELPAPTTDATTHPA
ncbi:MAG: hypothetical protein ACTJHW_04035 [Paenalcaligenes sp.]